MKLIGNLFVSLFKYKKIATILLLVTNIAYSILLKAGEVFTPHANFFEMMGALEVYRLLWSLGLLWILRYQRIIKMSKPP